MYLNVTHIISRVHNRSTTALHKVSRSWKVSGTGNESGTSKPNVAQHYLMTEKIHTLYSISIPTLHANISRKTLEKSTYHIIHVDRQMTDRQTNNYCFTPCCACARGLINVDKCSSSSYLPRLDLVQRENQWYSTCRS